MTEQQAIEYKEDLVKVKEELKQLKKKYFTEKKSFQKRLEALKTDSKDPNQAGEVVNQIKFTGGGFKMSIPGGVNN